MHLTLANKHLGSFSMHVDDNKKLTELQISEVEVYKCCRLKEQN